MDRRSFLKILGAASAAFILPTSIQYLVDKVVKGNYNEDLLHQLFGDILSKLTPEEFEWLDNLNETYYVYRIGNDATVTKNPKVKYFGEKLSLLNSELIAKTNNIFEYIEKPFICAIIGIQNYLIFVYESL